MLNVECSVHGFMPLPFSEISASSSRRLRKKKRDWRAFLFIQLLKFAFRAGFQAVSRSVKIKFQFADGTGFEIQRAKHRALATYLFVVPRPQLERHAATAGKHGADLPR